MRAEYIVVQRLMWDAAFRQAFLHEPEVALSRCYPALDPVSASMLCAAPTAGLEEEAYRRLASVQGNCASVFRMSHRLLQAFVGEDIYQDVAARLFRNDLESSGFSSSEPMEILEPADGYVVGPIVLAVAAERIDTDLSWLLPLMNYDWAIFVASRVALGWPAPETLPPLAPGASLVSADYDLKALIVQIRRLEQAGVGYETFRWRLSPSPGMYRAAVYPGERSGARIVSLPTAEYEELRSAVTRNRRSLSQGTLERMQMIGLVLDASFLCCPNEVLEQARLKQVAETTEMVPH